MLFLNDKFEEQQFKMFFWKPEHSFFRPGQKYIIKQLWKHYFIDVMSFVLMCEQQKSR